MMSQSLLQKSVAAGTQTLSISEHSSNTNEARAMKLNEGEGVGPCQKDGSQCYPNLPPCGLGSFNYRVFWSPLPPPVLNQVELQASSKLESLFA